MRKEGGRREEGGRTEERAVSGVPRHGGLVACLPCCVDGLALLAVLSSVAKMDSLRQVRCARPRAAGCAVVGGHKLKAKDK